MNKFQGHPKKHGDSTTYTKSGQGGATLSQRSQAATKGVRQSTGKSPHQASKGTTSTTKFDK